MLLQQEPEQDHKFSRGRDLLMPQTTSNKSTDFLFMDQLWPFDWFMKWLLFVVMNESSCVHWTKSNKIICTKQQGKLCHLLTLPLSLGGLLPGATWTSKLNIQCGVGGVCNPVWFSNLIWDSCVFPSPFSPQLNQGLKALAIYSKRS